MPFISYNVVPRYTAGSPAAVDQSTAEDVMEEEIGAYCRLMTGRLGADEQTRARRLGLSGIVEFRQGFANHSIIHDMITGSIRDTRVFDKQLSPSGAMVRGLLGEISEFVTCVDVVKRDMEHILIDAPPSQRSYERNNIKWLESTLTKMKSRLREWTGKAA